jgi:hypothetical protein
MSLRKYPRDSLLLRRLFKEAVSTHALDGNIFDMRKNKQRRLITELKTTP